VLGDISFAAAHCLNISHTKAEISQNEIEYKLIPIQIVEDLLAFSGALPHISCTVNS